MANGPQGTYLIPQPPPKSASQLATQDGKQQASTNIGGITVGGPGYGAGAIIQAPGLVVPLGLVVRVRGNPSNGGTVRIGRYREDLLAGTCDLVQPNTEIIFPVDNLAQILVYIAVAADGVTISVRSE